MNKFNSYPSVHRSSGVRITKPNQALTVRQINERFTQGKPVPVAKTPIVEPKILDGISPLRQPYVDYVDLFNYGELLSTKLNESTSLLTEKQKEFLRVQSKAKQDAYEELKKSFQQGQS